MHEGFLSNCTGAAPSSHESARVRSNLVDTVHAHMKRMRSPDDMDESLVRCDGKNERTVCGNSKSRFASYECRTCVETIHLAAVCKSVIGSSENTVIDAPVVARTATRTVSADSRTASAHHVDQQVTCELFASQLG